MSKLSSRNGFLLGLTLSELGFIMFFLLLVLSALLLHDKSDELKKLEGKIDTIMKDNLADDAVKSKLKERLSEILGTEWTLDDEDLDTLFTRLTRVIKFDDLVSQYKKEITKLEKSIKTKEELEKEKEKLASEKARLQKKYEIALAKKAQQYDKAAAILTANGLTGELGESVHQLVAQNENRKGQLEHAKRRQQKAGNGLDHPPCWANAKTGTIEYLFDITIYSDYLQIEPTWPDKRNEAAKNIPSVSVMAGKKLSFPQFKRYSQGVLDWSKQQTPQCRHFVRINDTDGTSKNEFKQTLLTIENYFYKYLVRK